MIHQALQLLQKELDAYIKTFPHPAPVPDVVLANISQLDTDTGTNFDFNNKVLISLVNVEEESTFKNLPHFTKTFSGVRYANPPVFLNLYLLFTASFPVERYGSALRLLSLVIQFFQGNNVFNFRNTTQADPNTDPTDPEIERLQLVLDLYTMTFEQINHLWGSLGGKQIPFAMYKARLVRIDDRRTSGTGSVIEEITGVVGKDE